mmetsp:Transcript_77937/g.223327  ORF Transcript_77937/g.223327 Transcript_77937/m.223327 type:complete len:143 (+) Transcript_77937:147-575(+)
MSKAPRPRELSAGLSAGMRTNSSQASSHPLRPLQHPTCLPSKRWKTCFRWFLSMLRGNTSIGTIKHEEGLCKPCAFVGSDIGCSNGITCQFCHISHGRAVLRRRCKSKREHYKKLIDSQVALLSKDEQSVASLAFETEDGLM